VRALRLTHNWAIAMSLAVLTPLGVASAVPVLSAAGGSPAVHAADTLPADDLADDAAQRAPSAFDPGKLTVVVTAVASDGSRTTVRRTIRIRR
jgi:hypothetical protein